MLVVTLIGTVVLLVAVNLIVLGSKPSYSGAAALAGIVFGLMFLCISPTMVLTSFCVMIAAIGCGIAQARPAVFFVWSLVVSVPGLALAISWGMREVERIARLREQYPIVSLEDRLAYEQAPAGAVAKALATDSTSGETMLPDSGGKEELVTRWKNLEERFARTSRAERRIQALQWIHDESLEHFNSSPGFGVVRSIRPSERWLERPEAPPILLPPAEESPSVPIVPDIVRHVPDAQKAPRALLPSHEQRFDTLWESHGENVLDFVNPEGFGWVQDRAHVAGFEPHKFREMPSLTSRRGESPDPKQADPWQLRQLDLVSLLKHAEPRVYISEHLPRMEELSSANAPTRPTNRFEAGALAKLAAGEDLVIEEESNRLRMVGSLRATKVCLDCHECKRGALLGAFSYEFHRMPPIRPAEPGKEPHVRRDLFEALPSASFVTKKESSQIMRP